MPDANLPDATPTIEITAVPWQDDDLARLCLEQQHELMVRYDETELPPGIPADQVIEAALVRVDGEPAACGALRFAADHGPGVGELKRMFVRPAFRGRGLARLVLTELERSAVAHGLVRVVLETGARQPESVSLYRSSGYRRIRNYGYYANEPESLCYARWLVDVGARALVLTGTGRPGPTTTAAALSGLLRERGLPHAWLVVDALTQVWPRPPEDPGAVDLAFESLQRLAPGLADRGYRHVVLARVLAEPADEERYELALDGADVTVVDVDALTGGRDLTAADVAAEILRDVDWVAG